MSASTQTVRYEISIYGPFQVRDSLGKVYEIRRQKEWALIAALCLSPNQKRTRKWLRTLLWGNHSEARSAANLRQAVWRIKEAFSDAPELIESDDHSVWLRSDAVHSVNTSDRWRYDLLEGIDIEEESFEDWLRSERQVDGDTAQPASNVVRPNYDERKPSRPKLYIYRDPTLAFAEPSLSRLSAGLRQTLMSLELFDVREGVIPPSSCTIVSLEQYPRGRVGITIKDGADERLIWSHTVAAGADDDHAIPQLISGCLDALMTEFSNEISLPEAVHYSALAREYRRILDGFFIPGFVKPSEMEVSLENALDLSPSGVTLGLRNSVRMLRYGERIDGFDGILREVVEEDLRKSFEGSPNNALVLALASHTTSLFLGEPEMAMSYGRLAVSIDPDSAMIASLHSLSLLRAGRVNSANQWSRRASLCSGNSRYQAFFLGTSACTQAALGNYDRSIQLARAAKVQLPHFRALNKLLFLGYEKLGKYQEAEAASQEIRRVEPEFGYRLLREKTPTVGIDILRREMVRSAKNIGLD